MCTVFRNAGHCSPVASTPAAGGQYHQVSSRGRDDMHFDLPVLSLMRARLAWTWTAELEGLWWKAPYLVYRMQGKGGWGRVV